VRSGVVGGAKGAASVTEDDELLTPLERRRKKYLKRKRNTKRREDETLEKLASFKESIISANIPNKPREKTKVNDEVKLDNVTATNEEMDGENEMLSGLLKREFEVEGEELEHDTWLSHRIKFTRRPQDFDHMARTDDVNDYVIFDAREAQKSGSKGGSSSSSSSRGRDRDRDRDDRDKEKSSSSNSLGIDASEWNSGSSRQKRKERD